jgi:hypothetical protein
MLSFVEQRARNKGFRGLRYTKDDSLSTAKRIISDMCREFAMLEAALEENASLRANLVANLQRVGSMAGEMYCDGHPMHCTLKVLHCESEHAMQHTRVLHVQTSARHPESGGVHGPCREQGSQSFARSEIHMFNGQLCSLQRMQAECTALLRKKHHYSQKLKKLGGPSLTGDRDLQRRLRNEQKLNDAAGQLIYLKEKLFVEVEMCVEKKERVLTSAVESYLLANHWFYKSNPVEAAVNSLHIQQPLWSPKHSTSAARMKCCSFPLPRTTCAADSTLYDPRALSAPPSLVQFGMPFLHIPVEPSAPPAPQQVERSDQPLRCLT